MIRMESLNLIKSISQCDLTNKLNSISQYDLTNKFCQRRPAEDTQVDLVQ